MMESLLLFQANVNKLVGWSEVGSPELGCVLPSPAAPTCPGRAQPAPRSSHPTPSRHSASPSVWRCCHVYRRRRRLHMNSYVLM